MADEHRRRVELRGDMFDIGFVIVQPRYDQRLGTAACAMSAQAERVRGIAATGEPGQKVRLPAPRVAIAAVDEQERRLARLARRQSFTDFEVRLSG